MSTAQISVTAKYTGVGGASQTVAFSGAPTYDAESIGRLDIPTTDDGSVTPVVYEIPFITIAEAKVLILKNTNTHDMAVRFNGAVADEFNLAPNAFVCITQPTAPGGAPVTSCDVVLNDAQGVTAGTFEYMVFGA